MYFNTQQQQKQKQDHDETNRAFQMVLQAQNNPLLSNLLQLNQIYHAHHIAQLNQQLPKPTPVTPQEYAGFNHRCKQIVSKNHKIKKQILQLKNHLKHQLNIDDGNGSQKLEENRSIQQIKLISTDIKAKILALRQKQSMNRKFDIQTEQTSSNVQRSEQKMLPINLKMQEMKKGVQFLCRELKKIEYDSEVTEKYLKSSPGQEKRFEERSLRS